ncbi:MAG: GxxExxY protein [Candidatus Kaiserbacteria bacterium]|nr:GxxExxY protein [Candidatus Kaiserbacteria bacterium]
MAANNHNVDKVLHPDLSYKIVGICFEVHNELGQFAREKQYADLLEDKLKSQNLKYNRELILGDSGNIIDFLVENKIALELKTKRLVGRSEYRQIQNYLQQSKLDLGLLINFSDKFLRPKRILRTTARAPIRSDS